MKKEGLVASSQPTIWSAQYGNKALRLVLLKAPEWLVSGEVLSKEEIKSVLNDLRCNGEWLPVCFKS